MQVAVVEFQMRLVAGCPVGLAVAGLAVIRHQAQQVRQTLAVVEVVQADQGHRAAQAAPALSF
jgi:hypothetical protein